MTVSVSRTIAVGDIHGCLAALDAILNRIAPTPGDTLIFLGDYVDRGPDSRGVLDRLIALQQQVRLVPLLGNHDDLLLQVYDGRDDLYVPWLTFGGNATLESYNTLQAADIPDEHIAFLRACPLYHETERHIFIHGNYYADLPLADQSRKTLLWESLRERLPGPHCSGKMVILGHTSQKTGEILDIGYARCIDTRCYDAGWLTALDVQSGQIWQADKHGRVRNE